MTQQGGRRGGIRPEAIGRRPQIELGVLGDARATLQALLPQLQKKQDDNHLRTCISHYQEARKGLDASATGRDGGTLHLQHVMRVIDAIAAEDGVFTCDVGLPTVRAARYR